jgi:phosphatidylserine/phosphatidylglycerophosphate/cardiolipin synthase-like enzyme
MMSAWSNRQGCVLHIEVILCLLLGSCNPLTSIAPTSVTNSKATSTTPSAWMQVFFSDLGSPNAGNYEGGPDKYLVTALDQAHFTVDVAIYSLNLWSIRDAVIRAHKRGVNVRMVMESDNMDVKEVTDLKDAGIVIHGDRHEGLMHNKFMVIDHSEVWTGSLNYTAGSAYKDNNNLVFIQSIPVAEDYTREFNEMFEQNLFGTDVGFATPFPRLTIEGTPLEIYFSPDDGVEKRILQLVGGATESLYFLMYSFTADDIGATVIERSKAGVKVSGVMDAGQIKTSQGSEYDRFLQAGLDVRKDGINGLMHDKVMIIDRKIVITGSYNFTHSAETTNDENVLIIFSPDVAAQYLQEFQRIYAQAQH